VDGVDQKLDRMAVRSELVELKDQVAHLTERIAQLEKALN
jgi:ubiquinone biosynthesis protein UbiJ